MIPLGVTILVITWWKLDNEWAASRGERFDLKGSLLYSIFLVMLMYGFSRLPSPGGIALVGLGVVGFVGFVMFELRAQSPLLNIRLFRNRTFAFSSLAALINYSANFTVGFLLSLYLQYIKGLDPKSAGLILVAQPVVMALFAPIAGRLSDFLFILTRVTAETVIPMVSCGLIVLGMGFGFFSSPNTSAIMGSVEKRFYGVASAIVSTMRLLGQMLSMGLALMVFALFIGNVPITPVEYPALLKSIHTVFLICTVLCFFGIFVSLARGGRTETSQGPR